MSQYRYPDPKDTSKTYIPVATGQIIEVKLKDLDAFNAMCNAAVIEAALEAGVIEPPFTAEVTATSPETAAT